MLKNINCIFYLFLFLIPLSLQCEEKSLLDLECSDQFHVMQDLELRTFHIVEDDQTFGTVLSSDYGVLDFYDSKNEKQWTNLFDSLYDKTGNCVSQVKMIPASRWWHSSTRIECFSDKNEPLFTFDAEGDGKCFVFRDSENEKPLAIALWKPSKKGKCGYFFCNYIQDWSVMIVNRSYLQEKKISVIFLVWTLLKHSQKHLLNSSDLNYVKFPP